MQQPAIHQMDALEPKRLDVTVTVTRGAGPGTFQHDVTTLVAQGPGGSQFIVTWILAPNTDLSVKFNEPGIIPLSIPGGVKVQIFPGCRLDSSSRLLTTSSM